MFWEVLKTGNELLILKGQATKNYTTRHKEAAKEAWIAICDQYFLAKNDDRAKMYLVKRSEELYLLQAIKQYNDAIQTMIMVMGCIEFMDKQKMAKLVNNVYDLVQRIEPRTKIKLTKTPEANLKVMEKMLRSLITKHRVRYKQKKKIIDEQKVVNHFTAVAKIEQVLERNLGDISKINVAQWLAYEAQAMAKIKASRNGR